MKTPKHLPVLLLTFVLLWMGRVQAQAVNPDPELLNGDYQWTFDGPEQVNSTDRRKVSVYQDGKLILEKRFKGNDLKFHLENVPVSSGQITLTLERRYVKGGLGFYVERFSAIVPSLSESEHIIHLVRRNECPHLI